MRDNRGSTTPRDGDLIGVDAFQFGEPPVLHLQDEYADVRQDRDQIRITPPYHGLVIDEAVVREPRQGRENAPLAGRARRWQRVWDHLGHDDGQCSICGDLCRVEPASDERTLYGAHSQWISMRPSGRPWSKPLPIPWRRVDRTPHTGRQGADQSGSAHAMAALSGSAIAQIARRDSNSCSEYVSREAL